MRHSYLPVQSDGAPQAVRRPTFQNQTTIARIMDSATDSLTNPSCSTARLERMKRSWPEASLLGWCICSLFVRARRLSVHAMVAIRLMRRVLISQPTSISRCWIVKIVSPSPCNCQDAKCPCMFSSIEIGCTFFGAGLDSSHTVIVSSYFKTSSTCILHPCVCGLSAV